MPLLKLHLKVPNRIHVACSGGPDSMAVVDFFRRGRKEVHLVYFHHATEHAEVALAHVVQYAKSENLTLSVGRITTPKPSNASMEEHWRNERYGFFSTLDPQMGPIVTGHNLDDAVEWYCMSALHGEGKLIPSQRDIQCQNGTISILRPFLTTPKRDLETWCSQHVVPFVVDPSNASGPHMRTIVRNQLIPLALQVNPGLYTTIRKKILASCR